MSGPTALGRPEFVFDAGALARIYVPDVSTRNVAAIYEHYSTALSAPSIVRSEITAAWLAALRDGDIDRPTYELLKTQFLRDTEDELIKIYSADDLHDAVVEVQEQNADMVGRSCRITIGSAGVELNVPKLETSDAYYVALAILMARVDLVRTIFVTNDGVAWRAAYALGVEVFHGRTCDRGLSGRHVGAPGAHFPENPRCCPCQLDGCPSGFGIPLETLPLHLDSGIPLPR